MEIRKLTSEEFWPIFKNLRTKYFNETLWFSSFDVRTTREIEAFESLSSGMKSRWELHLGVYLNNEIIGWCSSYQTRAYELHMMNSIIFPEHRRKGFYSKLLNATLNEAQIAGFQTVTSHHVCTNNSVIMAKLKYDFKITGFEVMDEFGIVVKLTKYLNAMREEAIKFRSGQEMPSEVLKSLFRI